MERPSSSAMQLLYAELAAVKSQNARLEEDNMQLLRKLNRVSLNQHTNSTMHVEATIMAAQMEDQRDGISEKFEVLKKRYNKVLKELDEKQKRCKALEREFHFQKTLTGLVMKSAVDQRISEQQILLQKRQSEQRNNSDIEIQQLRTQLEKLEMARDEAYDIIDEMDFELDSVDLLEKQNQSMRRELAELKAQLASGTEAVVFDDPPPKYEPADSFTTPEARREYRHNVVSSCNSKYLTKNDDEFNRAARTQSLIQSVEADSNCQRRERLRSRFQRTIHDKLEKEEREDKEFTAANS